MVIQWHRLTLLFKSTLVVLSILLLGGCQCSQKEAPVDTSSEVISADELSNEGTPNEAEGETSDIGDEEDSQAPEATTENK